jgi:octaprenyl-diphosphate synthase
MKSLSDIKKPLSDDLKAFRKVYRSAVRSKVALLDVIMQYILKTKGKQVRPLFVLHSAGMFGKTNEKSYRAATLIELLHTATLVHDDVVDNSFQRRGRFSINYLWRNKIAVLAGDYLLSRGMLLALENKDFEILEIVSRAVKDMSEGELLQLEKARKLDIDEKIYYEVIQKKTASLFGACMASGAAAAVNDPETVHKMYRIGENAGMAFQIKDDLFDLETGNDTGKPSGLDIQEKKMTLPLIYLINQADSKEKREIVKVVKNHSTEKDRVNWLIDRISKSGGIIYARKKMDEFTDTALKMLEDFPENEHRQALADLIRYTVERKK